MVLNFGIIGCGNVAPTYLYVLDKNKDAKTVALADTDIMKAQKNAEIFGIKSVYSDYEQMLATEKLDAIIICTPHYLHHQQALTCANYDLPILCEKPLATTMEDIEEMIDLCRAAPFSTMLQRRCYPNTISTAKAVKKGLLGDIRNVYLDFSCHKSADFYDSWRGKKISGGGVLLSQTLHRIDQLVSIFGEPFSVSGTTETTRPYLEVEDYAQGKILFQNNVLAEVEANNSSGDTETRSIISIIGTKGHITLSDDKTLEWKLRGLPRPEELDINAIPTDYRPAYYGPGHEIVINDFVDAVKKNRQPMITAADSLPAMKIIFGLYESARTGRTVFLK